jgi:hypothetical protein
MADSPVTYKIETAAVAERFRALSKKMQKRAAFFILGQGGKIQRDRSKAIAPVLREPDPRRKPGTLRNAIRMARLRPKSPDLFEMTIGVRTLSKDAVRKFKQAFARRTKSLAAFEKYKKAKEVKLTTISRNNPDDPYYWRWMEFKTRRAGLTKSEGKVTPMQPRPFMQPVFDRSASDILDAIVTTARDRVEQHAKEASGGNLSS